MAILYWTNLFLCNLILLMQTKSPHNALPHIFKSTNSRAKDLLLLLFEEPNEILKMQGVLG